MNFNLKWIFVGSTKIFKNLLLTLASANESNIDDDCSFIKKFKILKTEFYYLMNVLGSSLKLIMHQILRRHFVLIGKLDVTSRN